MSYEWIACERCNTGWMQTFDQSEKSLLEQLVLGHGATIHLDRPAQDFLARWIVKTDMTWDWDQETSALRDLGPDLEHSLVAVPQHQRTAFYEQRTIPEGWRIWIGHNQSTGIWAHVRSVSKLFVVPDNPSGALDRGHADGHWATFAIGDLCFQILAVTRPAVFDQEIPQGTAMRQIWPFVDPFDWPPRGRIEDVMLSYVANSIQPGSWDEFA
jgi:hypothetical protein